MRRFQRAGLGVEVERMDCSLLSAEAKAEMKTSGSSARVVMETDEESAEEEWDDGSHKVGVLRLWCAALVKHISVRLQQPPARGGGDVERAKAEQQRRSSFP